MPLDESGRSMQTKSKCPNPHGVASMLLRRRLPLNLLCSADSRYVVSSSYTPVMSLFAFLAWSPTLMVSGILSGPENQRRTPEFSPSDFLPPAQRAVLLVDLLSSQPTMKITQSQKHTEKMPGCLLSCRIHRTLGRQL